MFLPPGLDSVAGRFRNTDSKCPESPQPQRVGAADPQAPGAAAWLSPHIFSKGSPQLSARSVRTSGPPASSPNPGIASTVGRPAGKVRESLSALGEGPQRPQRPGASGNEGLLGPPFSLGREEATEGCRGRHCPQGASIPVRVPPEASPRAAPACVCNSPPSGGGNSTPYGGLGAAGLKRPRCAEPSPPGGSPRGTPATVHVSTRKPAV